MPNARKIRLTERRALLMRARDTAEEKVAAQLEPVFKKQFKRLERFLRRANLRKRIEKIGVPPEFESDEQEENALYKVTLFFLQKDAPASDTEEWEKWKQELTIALLLGLFFAVEILGQSENRIMTSRGRDPLTFDAEALILAYTLRTGQRLDDIALTAMAGVERIISEWYLTDKPFSDLMNSLRRYFNDSHVSTIARTLVGDIHAQMIIQQMVSYGLDTWYWDHKGEDEPCTNPITMVGKSYHGCKELNGKVFKLGDPMPPNAAHVNCHCLPTPEGL